MTSVTPPLAGLRVLDFSTLLPGPLAGLLLAEAGAEVIKVERPGTGGEQQRVAIARAIITRPPLILADEPTGDLDAAGGQAVVALLRALARNGQHTIIMATHNQRLVDEGDQLIRLANGRQESR